MSNRKIIAVVGPTSSGKSDLAVEIARYIDKNKKRFGVKGAEIISVDSRQMYKDLDIGSGKITAKEKKGIPHRLLGIFSPKKIISAEEFKNLTLKEIARIQKDGKAVILCGGAGFYLDAILKEKNLPQVKPDWRLRKKLGKMGAGELFKILLKKDPRRAGEIDGKNKARLVRAIEILKKTGEPIPEVFSGERFNSLKIGIKREKKDLEKRAEKRVGRMIKRGLIKEVKALLKKGASKERIKKLGFEYSIPLLYIEGKIPKEEMRKKLIRENLKYAKRQMTWFKREKDIFWVKNEKEALNLARKFFVGEIN